MQHAKLSASASTRWAACPGSVKVCEDIEDKGSPYAAEGNQAHDMAEKALRCGGDVEWEHVQTYVDYVRELPGDKRYEQRVDFSEWVPDGFGTADAQSIDGKTLHIVDLKYGKGVKVYAKNNSQLMLYGLGAYSELDMIVDIENIQLHIIQPRLDHIDVWECTVTELLAFGEWIRERAELALSDNPPRVAGEAQCRFCKAQATCPELYQFTLDTLGCEFEDLSDSKPESLGQDRLKRVLDNAALIKAWIGNVEQYVFDRVSAGGKFDGYKLVEGRSVRKWRSDKDATQKLIKLLGDNAYEKKILSPAKAEKALGKTRKAEIKELVFKPAGKPTLVPESDKRKPIGVSIEDFD